MSLSPKFQPIATGVDVKKYLHPSIASEILDYFFYFLKVFVVVGLVYVLIRFNLFDAVGVRGKSMFPTYNEKSDTDGIYVDILTPKFSDYQRGDVVVLIAPESCDPQKDLYIKRIIGLPGERIAFENGKVYVINKEHPTPGIILDESDYLSPSLKTYKNQTQNDGLRFEEKLVGQNECFFMGDNRGGSTDSRICGFGQKEAILGRAFFRVTPEEKRGFVKLPKYNI